jgi:hypothetical protein
MLSSHEYILPEEILKFAKDGLTVCVRELALPLAPLRGL